METTQLLGPALSHGKKSDWIKSPRGPDSTMPPKEREGDRNSERREEKDNVSLVYDTFLWLFTLA